MSSKAEARDRELIGSIINGRFLIKGRIAAGGMGVVYEGEQVPLGRPVAIKILESKQEEAIEQRFSERFLQEAAAVAKLSHPNTITLYDYGETGESDFYYAMEFVDGRTLSRAVYEDGPLDSVCAIHVGMQVAGSLREAHREGMIHRDLKPGNIMLTERLDDPFFVKVLDFGLVKLMGQRDGVELTQSGMLMGSPRYMSPEQVLGHSLDHRSDIYSFGAVLYLALTGYPPFRHGSQFEVLRAQVEEIPAPFATVRPEHQASARLEQLVFRCLEKDREARPSTMDEVALELRTCARELGIEEASLSGAVRSLPLPGPAEAPPESAASSALTGPAEAPQESLAPAETGPAPQPAHAPPPGPAVTQGPRRSSAPMIVGLIAALILVAIVSGGAAFLLGGEDAAPDVPVAALPSAPPTVTVLPEPAPATPEPSPVVRPEIVSEPPGARVRRGDVDLGDAPFTLDIPDGERWELTLTLEGHEPRTVLASAGRERIHVRLTPIAAAVRHASSGGRRPPPPSSTPTPQPLAPVITPTPVQPVRPAPAGRADDLRHPWIQ